MEKIRITKNNYFEKIGTVLKMDTLPETLSKSHLFLLKVTGGTNDWTKYDTSDSIKRTIDLYFEKLSDFLNKNNVQSNEEKTTKSVHDKEASKKEKTIESSPRQNKGKFASAREVAKDLIRKYVVDGESLQSLQSSYLGKHTGINNAAIKGPKIHVLKLNGKEVNETFTLASIYKEVLDETTKRPSKQENVTFIENFDEDVKHIRKFAGINERVKTSAQILTMLKGLQRAITSKTISKAQSRYVKEIERIQDMLIRLVNMANGRTPIKIEPKFLNRLVQIVGGEKIYYSITLIKSYIGMQGKQLEKEKIESFISRAEKALQVGKVLKDDPYLPRIKGIISTLKKRKGNEAVAISKADLNGLEGIVKACGCSSGLGKIYDTKGKTLRKCKKRTYSDSGKGACSYNKGLAGYGEAMTAEEIANMQFELLPFSGTWIELFGKPEKNFSMMFHGEPGAGKSTFLIKFSKYLSRFGSVLYVTSEEYGSETLKRLVTAYLNPFPENIVFVPNLDTTNVGDFDFVIFDSVTDAGIKLEDFKFLKKEYPTTGFILVLQHTKNGQFKGGKEWEHEAQIVGKMSNGTVEIYKNRYGVKNSWYFFDEGYNPQKA